MSQLPLVCPVCRTPAPGGQWEEHSCACGTSLSRRNGVVSYDWRRLLFERHRRRFLLNAALNNNGTLSYLLLPEASVSLESREDVGRFRDYLLRNAEPGRLLDVGCGVLEVPGYLRFPHDAPKRIELVGLDPLPPERPFPGTRVIGCSEYMPFETASFDTLAFATSLDHVCDLRTTLDEAARVLRPGGTLTVWMSDCSGIRLEILRYSLDWRLRDLHRALTGRQRRIDGATRIGPYLVYPDLTVMAVPRGSVDPFHTYHERPKQVIRAMRRAGLRLEDHSQLSRTEVFLTFRK